MIIDDLKQRLYQIAVAGFQASKEDFRLKKVIEELEKYKDQNPIFQKLYSLCADLESYIQQENYAAFMEAVFLVDAVDMVQVPSQVKLEENVEAVGEEKGAGETVKVTYRQAEPILNALYSGGSGRYAVLNEAYEQNSKVLKDYRVVPALIKGLDDSYSEMGELCRKILTDFGKNIVPMLKKDFDSNGKKGMSRRIEIIAQVSKEEENEFYLDILRGESSQQVKEEAILALAYEPKNKEFLLENISKLKGNPKDLALYSLSCIGGEEVVQYFLKELKKASSKTLLFVRNLADDRISKAVVEKMNEYFEEMKDFDQKQKLTSAQEEKMQRLFAALYNKASDEVLPLFRDIVKKNNWISDFKNASNSSAISHFGFGKYIGGGDFYNIHDAVGAVNKILVCGMISSEDKRLVNIAKTLYEEFPKNYTQAGFIAYLLDNTQDELYAAFKDKLVNSNTANQIVHALSYLHYDEQQKQYNLVLDYDYGAGKIVSFKKKVCEKLGTQLLRAMLERDGVFSEQLVRFYSENMRYYYYTYQNCKRIVRELQNVNDTETIGYFKDYYIRRIKNKTSEYSNEAYLWDLKSTGCTMFSGLVYPFVVNAKRQYVRNADYLQGLMDGLEMSVEQQINEVKAAINVFEKNKVLAYTNEQFDQYKQLLAELERKQV